MRGPGGRVSSWLDRLPGPNLRIGGRPRCAFHVCGLVGLAVALTTAFGTVIVRGDSPVVMVALASTGVAAFVAAAHLGQRVTGREVLTFYHDLVVVLIVEAVVLVMFGWPLLPYLDAVILGIGGFAAVGRLGCLMVGCCYGRPAPAGIRYGAAHARAGFPPYLVGQRLVPVQALESVWAALTTAGAFALVTADAPPGGPLAAWVALYAVGRFAFEYLRGDAERPVFARLSEAQWTSLGLIAVITVLQLAAVVPHSSWLLAASAVPVTIAAGSALTARSPRGRRAGLVAPRHLRELADLAEHLGGQAAATRAVGCVRVLHAGESSKGVQLTAGTVRGAQILHLAFSSPRCAWRARDCEVLARVIAGAAGEAVKVVGNVGVRPGAAGTVHLLLEAELDEPRAATHR